MLEGEPIEKMVNLRDQFVEEEAPVGRPVLFCVPVQKHYREGWEVLKNERDHLTFYEIEPRELEKRIWAIDQFGQRELRVMHRELLGVPSLKTVPREPQCVRFEQLPLGAASINAAAIGGTVATVVNGHGYDRGTLFLNGQINDFAIGGQELWIDDVCPVIEK